MSAIRRGLLLGAAAGALFGVSDVAIKWLTQASPGPLLGLVSPWTLPAMIAGVIAFYASARSLQIGDGVEVIALTSVAANLAAIIGGILVFHEPIGSGATEIGARVLSRSPCAGPEYPGDLKRASAGITPTRRYGTRPPTLGKHV